MAKPKKQDGALVDRLSPLLRETDKIYKLGDKATAEQGAAIRAQWATQLSDETEEKGREKGEAIGYVMMPVITGGRSSRLLSLVFEDEGQRQHFIELGEDFLAVSKAVGRKPSGFNRWEASQLLQALDQGSAVPDAEASLEDFARFVSGNKVGYKLRAWAEPREHSDNGRQSGIAKVLAEKAKNKAATTPTTVDPRAALKAQLAKANADKAAALAAEDGDSLKAAKAEISEIEAELTKLTAAPPATAAMTGVNGDADPNEVSFINAVKASKLGEGARNNLFALVAGGNLAKAQTLFTTMTS